MVERGVIAVNDGDSIDLAHLFRHEPLPAAELYSVERGILRVEPAAESLGDLTTAAAASPQMSAQMPVSIGAVEAQLLADALARAGGNVSAAARLVGLTRAQFAYRMTRRGGKR